MTFTTPYPYPAKILYLSGWKLCWPGPKRLIVLTEIYPKFAKPLIKIAGAKTSSTMPKSVLVKEISMHIIKWRRRSNTSFWKMPYLSRIIITLWPAKLSITMHWGWGWDCVYFVLCLVTQSLILCEDTSPLIFSSTWRPRMTLWHIFRWTVLCQLLFSVEYFFHIVHSEIIKRGQSRHHHWNPRQL